MKLPEKEIPIVEIPLDKNLQLFMKREDLIHPEISGNKYWKLFFNIQQYKKKLPQRPLLITFGGAFSNHIAAVSALGKQENFETLAIIRGEELYNKWQENPTLVFANSQGMRFEFINREAYRNKDILTKASQDKYPEALIIPEGGTNALAVEGVQFLLDERTKSFDYLCSAVGTGGTLAGISKFAETHQKVVGFKAVNDDSLQTSILNFSKKSNFQLVDAHGGSYGKISEELVKFINEFFEKFGIPLDPIYTGKMMMKLFNLIENNFFPENSKILAIHTGGLQGIEGANILLKKQNKTTIKF